MSDEQELLARIGQLAGQINIHKSRDVVPNHPSKPHSHRGAYQGSRGGATPHAAYSGYPRSNPSRLPPYIGRGSYNPRYQPQRRGINTHRNRTLVLNNHRNQGTANDGGHEGHAAADAGSDPATGALNSSSTTTTSAPGSSTTNASGTSAPSGWVARRDRHMQLINSAVFERESEARTRAIEETRRYKAQKRAERDKAKVLRHVRSFTPRHLLAPSWTIKNKSAPGGAVTARPHAYEIMINNIPFQVANGGSKLICLSNDPLQTRSVPSTTEVGGVKFVRSKNGNLHRLGAVAEKRKTRGVLKKNELCKRFTATGTCYKGPGCRYLHDPIRVAICKDFLLAGSCPNGDACDLSHEPTPERTPACVHFLRGRCTNPECRYAHVRVNPSAPVCRDFAIIGFCGKGASCEQRHVHECPDYANSGQCKNKKCPLPHIDRAGQIRKIAANTTDTREGAENDKDREGDVSSEEEDNYEEIGENDVSSDESDDELVYIQGEDTGEMSGQQDFISV